MSQSNMMNHNIPNGVSPLLNGIDSSHSSRDSSPTVRTYPIPQSQLPPQRTIPSNQLPPTSKAVNHLTQNYANLQINHVTPSTSPKLFSTSTPVDPGKEERQIKPNVQFSQGNVLSPITTTGFTHSATSHFSNVPLNNQNKDNNLNTQHEGESARQPSQNNPNNVPLRPNFNGGSLLPHQNSLPNTAMPPRPPLQASLSQPRLMAYQNPQTSTNSTLTQPIGTNQFVPQSNQIPQSSNSQAPTSQQNLVKSSPNMTPVSQFNQTALKQPVNPFPQNPQMRPNFIPPNSQANIQNSRQFGSQNALNQPQMKPISQNMQNIPQQPAYSQSTNMQNFPYSNQPQYTNPQFTNQTPQKTNSPFSNPPINSQSTTQTNMQNMPHVNKMMPPTSMQYQPNLPMNQNQQIRPPSLLNHSSSPNLFQKQMPPKTNSLPTRPENVNMMQQNPMSMPPTNTMSMQSPSMNTMSMQSPPMQTPPMNTMPPNIMQTQSLNSMPPKSMHTPPMNPLQPPNAPRPNLHSNRYPNQPQFNPMQQQVPSQQVPLQQQHVPLQQQVPLQQGSMPMQQQNYQQKQPYQNSYYPQGVTQTGFNKLWGADNFDLLQTPNILPPTKVETPKISLGNELLDSANCHPDIFRCTMTKIPESNSLLQKSRLPLGVLIHPFRDLNHLPVIQCNTIVRCRACRTYINPFVFFVDNKRWKCNLCYRVNELPEEFQYDPVTKSYGDPSRRPEVKTSTIEYIAPAEYMLRPPQPAVYLILLDISRAAIESGYLHTACNVLQTELANLPGDARTQIGFIAYDSALHFFSLADGLSQPHEMTVLDIDDIFLPCPDNLLVNLQDRMDLISDLLTQLPNRYNNSFETGSALGAALQAAHKMMSRSGGRVTIFQASLPTIGPGALLAREDPSQRAGSEAQHLNPANDFYKRLALDCSGQQIAVDVFLINSQYVDLATISGISRFSGGCIYHFPLFKATRTLQNEGFERSLRRYLTRKIGFEAVMRIRCTRGLAIHTFHGNFFVRSTDLLSLPNVNPDAGFGMQVAIEENLSDVQTVCFQAALLYTSSKGERRIRVHTLCLPVCNNLSDLINSADQQCIIGLLSKMAVDRSMQSSLSDAREAFINVAIDILSSYKVSQNLGSGNSGLLAPRCLRLLPLYISALLKSPAFRSGISTRLDDRVKAMCDMKTRPLPYLIQQIYPDLYPIHNLQDQSVVLNDDEEPVPMPPHLQLTARSIDSNGAYLLDMGEHMVIIVCSAVSPTFLNQVLGVSDYNSIGEQMYELPLLDNEHNQRLNMFINYLNEEKPMNATLQIMRDNSQSRGVFLERFIEDRVETALSYHEFLQHLKTQVK